MASPVHVICPHVPDTVLFWQMERFGFCLQRFIWSALGVSCLPVPPVGVFDVTVDTETVFVPSAPVVVVVVVVVVDPSEFVWTTSCFVTEDPSEFVVVVGGFVVVGGVAGGLDGAEPCPIQIGIPDESTPPWTVPVGHGTLLPPEDVGGTLARVLEPDGVAVVPAPYLV
jgi:hypothetical protein